jgi:hypothetical protein
MPKMPTAARSTAAVAKLVISSVLKSDCAVERASTWFIDHTRVTGTPPLACRSCSSIAGAIGAGALAARITHAIGIMWKWSAVSRSVSCASGTYTVGMGG